MRKMRWYKQLIADLGWTREQCEYLGIPRDGPATLMIERGPKVEYCSTAEVYWWQVTQSFATKAEAQAALQRLARP